MSIRCDCTAGRRRCPSSRWERHVTCPSLLLPQYHWPAERMYVENTEWKCAGTDAVAVCLLGMGTAVCRKAEALFHSEQSDSMIHEQSKGRSWLNKIGYGRKSWHVCIRHTFWSSGRCEGTSSRSLDRCCFTWDWLLPHPPRQAYPSRNRSVSDADSVCSLQCGPRVYGCTTTVPLFFLHRLWECVCIYSVNKDLYDSSRPR